MVSTDETLAAICPKIMNSSSKDTYIAMATEDLSPSFFGDKIGRAIAYLAAHTFTLATTRTHGESGLITAKTEARLSISFWNAVNIKSNSDLHMSYYGKMLLSLIHKTSPAALSSSGINTVDNIGAHYGG